MIPVPIQGNVAATISGEKALLALIPLLLVLGVLYWLVVSKGPLSGLTDITSGVGRSVSGILSVPSQFFENVSTRMAEGAQRRRENRADRDERRDDRREDRAERREERREDGGGKILGFIRRR